MLAYLALGLSMGLNAGLSPGPLMTLVVTASVRSGWAGGLRVALAPLITDAPIIALSVLLVGSLPPEALRWVGTVGGLVVIWLGVETLRSARTATLPDESDPQANPRQELWRGVLVNALNPHPYLFWATVGGPALVRGWRISPWYVLAFLLPFYLLLIGSKMALAWLVSHQASALSKVWYRRLLTGCGLVMLVLGGLLIWQMWSNAA
jgi:threonine/homoserine/homoserine lactone efflux protein